MTESRTVSCWRWLTVLLPTDNRQPFCHFLSISVFFVRAFRMNRIFSNTKCCHMTHADRKNSVYMRHLLKASGKKAAAAVVESTCMTTDAQLVQSRQNRRHRGLQDTQLVSSKPTARVSITRALWRVRPDLAVLDERGNSNPQHMVHIRPHLQSLRPLGVVFIQVQCTRCRYYGVSHSVLGIQAAVVAILISGLDWRYCSCESRTMQSSIIGLLLSSSLLLEYSTSTGSGRMSEVHDLVTLALLYKVHTCMVVSGFNL